MSNANDAIPLNEHGKRDADAGDDDVAIEPERKALKTSINKNDVATATAAVERCRTPAHDRAGNLLVDGDRIEVEWQINAAEDDDEDEGEAEEEDKEEKATTITWWPCVVRRATPEDAKSVATNINDALFTLDYEARDGFEAEKRVVLMLASQRCEDATDAGVLKWRREGDDFVDNEEDEDDGDEDDDVPTTMREILEAQGRIDAQDGETLEHASMAAFSTLPMDQQMSMATAFAGFKEKLMAKLSGLASAKGDNGVVTKDDIESILSDIKNAR